MTDLRQAGVPKEQILKESGHAANSTSANGYMEEVPDEAKTYRSAVLFGAAKAGVNTRKYTRSMAEQPSNFGNDLTNFKRKSDQKSVSASGLTFNGSCTFNVHNYANGQSQTKVEPSINATELQMIQLLMQQHNQIHFKYTSTFATYRSWCASKYDLAQYESKCSHVGDKNTDISMPKINFIVFSETLTQNENSKKRKTYVLSELFDPVLYEDLEVEFKKADQEEAFNTIMKEVSNAVDIAWSLRDINSI